MTEPNRLAEALHRFDPGAQAVLDGIRASGGVLEPSKVQALAGVLEVELPELMIRLLPVARAFARSPVSDYRVGAVAATPPTDSGWGRLYLGANVEFPGEALGLTLHAEQAVALNAFFDGQFTLDALAVSSLPCGHCRQFLSEVGMPAVVYTIREGGGVTRHTLNRLLPAAFGPSDLGVEVGLAQQRPRMIALTDTDFPQPRPTSSAGVTVDTAGNSRTNADLRLVEEALAAARSSYAPYTGTFAGCALRTEEGGVHAGGYVENAAFNPSVLALQAALLHLHLRGPGLDEARISEVALVEVPGPTTQRAATRRLLDAIAPEAAFSYHHARVV